MNILLHPEAANRLRPRLGPRALNATFYQLTDRGVTGPGGARVSAEKAPIGIVWLSVETFLSGVTPQFGDVIMANPHIRWVQSASAGIDRPLFARMLGRGVRLTTSDAQAISISEFVMAQVAAEFYPFAAYRAAQAARAWRRIPFVELSQSRWLIIGYGAIGREIAQRAKAFGAYVTGVRRSGGTDAFADTIITPREQAEALSAADIVILACPLSMETRDLADQAFFAGMKAGSIFVNVGRGGLVDEHALLAALTLDRPTRAILDVTRVEPLPDDSPLWAHPKVRLSAHTSSLGSGVLARGDELFLDNLARYGAGQPLHREVVRESAT